MPTLAEVLVELALPSDRKLWNVGGVWTLISTMLSAWRCPVAGLLVTGLGVLRGMDDDDSSVEVNEYHMV
jgi:hypothetical protein